MKCEVKINGDWNTYDSDTVYSVIEDVKFPEYPKLKNLQLMVAKELKANPESSIIEILEDFDDLQIHAFDALMPLNNIWKLISLVANKEYKHFESDDLEYIGADLLYKEIKHSAWFDLPFVKFEDLIKDLCDMLEWNASYGYITFGESIDSGAQLRAPEANTKLELTVTRGNLRCNNFMNSYEQDEFILSLGEDINGPFKVEPSVNFLKHCLELKPDSITDLAYFTNVYREMELDANVLHNLADQKGTKDILEKITATWDYHPYKTLKDIVDYALAVAEVETIELVSDNVEKYFDLTALAQSYLKRYRVKGSNELGLFALN